VDVEVAVALVRAGTTRRLAVGEWNRDGTTTLGVLDDGTTSAARNTVLADRAVGHVVVAVNIGVEGGWDVHLGDGELVLLATASNRKATSAVVGWWARGTPWWEFTRNTLGVEVTLGQFITLRLDAVASPTTREGVGTVASNGVANVKAGPVIALVLLSRTSGVGVAASAELASINTPRESSRCLLDGKAGHKESGRCELHCSSVKIKEGSGKVDRKLPCYAVWQSTRWLCRRQGSRENEWLWLSKKKQWNGYEKKKTEWAEAVNFGGIFPYLIDISPPQSTG
jgi:hypothetical protein